MTSASKVNGAAAMSGGKRSSNRSHAAALTPERPRLFLSILVPTDFSAESREVLHQALQLAELNNGSVCLLHVIDKRKLAALERLALLPDDQSLIATAEKKLVSFAQTGGRPVVPVFPSARLGEPWREIADAAKSRKSTVVMLPTRGRTGLKRALLGSVAERVVRAAPCPVLIVRRAPANLARKGESL